MTRPTNPALIDDNRMYESKAHLGSTRRAFGVSRENS
jgi:hypothetical protein